MGKNRLYQFLSRIVDIKPGEETLAVLLFSCFFLITSPHTIIKALRYADLLTKEGIGGLPIAYLCAAVVTGLVVLFYSKIHVRLSNQLLFIANLAFFIISGFLLHLLFQTDFGKGSAFLSYFYWVQASVLAIVLMTQFWLIVNEVFNPREAKRLIGFFGNGGILGGVLGELLARFLSKSNQANLLLPLARGLLFACIFVVRAIFVVRKKQISSVKPTLPKKQPPGAKKAGFKDSFNAVRKNHYLLLISAIVVIKIIVSTFIDFQFSSAVEYHYSSQEDMQAFLGLFYAGLLTFAFFLNIFLTSNLLKDFGIQFTLLLAPITLFLCSWGLIFAPIGMLPAIFIKGGEESLTFSLSQSAREILYIPIDSELKFILIWFEMQIGFQRFLHIE